MPERLTATRIRIIPTLLPALLCGAATAQTWVPVTSSAGVGFSECAYDSWRERAITAYQDGRCFEHDGSRWLPIPGLPPNGNPPLLVYDSLRARMMALSRAGSAIATWEYDGLGWQVLGTSTSPPWRNWSAIACDAARGEVVLFGGDGAAGLADETWTWDGVDWTQRQPATVPAAREQAAMAYDPSRGVIVMFGGFGGGYRDDHWEWNGTDWTQRTLPTVPEARSRARLAFDPARSVMVLYGGFGLPNGVGTVYDQPWEFDGQQWLPRTIATAPPGRTRHSMVGTAAGVRIFGGNTNVGDRRTEIWDYDGSQFVQLSGLATPGASAALDAARGRTVVLGYEYAGFPAVVPVTWEWDGQQLARLAAGGPMPLRWAMPLADAGSGRVLGFGGSDGFGMFGDTWTFDGSQWQQLTVPGPSPRGEAALAFDAARGVVVLFGGDTFAGTPLGDTWEWNGATWTLRPAGGPAARSRATMAFDPVNGRCLLNGGHFGGPTFQSDTWSWNGVLWSLVDTTLPQDGQTSMAWSAQLGAMVLTQNSMTGLADPITYRLQGSVWSAGVVGPKLVHSFSTAADPTGRVFGLGGADGLSVSLMTTTPAQVASLGPGCSNAGVPAGLALRDRPRPGTTLRLELIGARHGQVVLFAGSHQLGTTQIGACQVHVQQPALLGVTTTNAAGQSVLPLAVPNATGLLGVQMGMQAVVGEPGGPFFGAHALSDALRLVVGD